MHSRQITYFAVSRSPCPSFFETSPGAGDEGWGLAMNAAVSTTLPPSWLVPVLKAEPEGGDGKGAHLITAGDRASGYPVFKLESSPTLEMSSSSLDVNSGKANEDMLWSRKAEGHVSSLVRQKW